VSGPGDAAEPLLAAARVLPRHKADSRSEVAAGVEDRGTGNSGDDGAAGELCLICRASLRGTTGRAALAFSTLDIGSGAIGHTDGGGILGELVNAPSLAPYRGLASSAFVEVTMPTLERYFRVKRCRIISPATLAIA
jgi:hypothetical protein